MSKRTIYYRDELNDDFASNNIVRDPIKDSYNYYPRNPVYLFFKFLIYGVIIRPIVYLYIKVKYHQRYINRKVLRRCKTGCFVYGNHTNADLDSFSPSGACFPKYVHIVANQDAVSIKGIKTLVKMLGAVPVPSSIATSKNFMRAIRDITANGDTVMIYPEAHIWPYYNDIRPFKEVSFAYPVLYDKPVYCLTNIYKKRLIGRRPKVVTYVDGPFFADRSLDKQSAKKELRNVVYSTMKAHVESNPKYEYVKYIKVYDKQE